jgi:FtsH-binding integral membrane protein
MRKVWKWVVAGLLLALMLACASPASDIPITTLRTWQIAIFAVLTTMFAVQTGLGTRQVLVNDRFKTSLQHTSLRADVLSLACVRRV